LAIHRSDRHCGWTRYFGHQSCACHCEFGGNCVWLASVLVWDSTRTKRSNIGCLLWHCGRNDCIGDAVRWTSIHIGCGDVLISLGLRCTLLYGIARRVGYYREFRVNQRRSSAGWTGAGAASIRSGGCAGQSPNSLARRRFSRSFIGGSHGCLLTTGDPEAVRHHRATRLMQQGLVDEGM